MRKFNRLEPLWALVALLIIIMVLGHLKWRQEAPQEPQAIINEPVATDKMHFRIISEDSDHTELCVDGITHLTGDFKDGYFFARVYSWDRKLVRCSMEE